MKKFKARGWSVRAGDLLSLNPARKQPGEESGSPVLIPAIPFSICPQLLYLPLLLYLPPLFYLPPLLCRPQTSPSAPHFSPCPPHLYLLFPLFQGRLDYKKELTVGLCLTKDKIKFISSSEKNQS